MFADLVAGLRHIKHPLTAGYAALLALWILFADAVPTVDEAVSSGDEVKARVGRLFDDLGPAAAISLVTFLALMLGAIMLPALAWPMRSITERFARWGNLDLALNRGEILIYNKKGPRIQLNRTEAAVDALRRHREEVEYRVLLGLALCLPVAASMYTDLDYWWTVLGPTGLMISGLYIALTAVSQSGRDVTYFHARRIVDSVDSTLLAVNGDGRGRWQLMAQLLRPDDLSRIFDIDRLEQLIGGVPAGNPHDEDRDEAGVKFVLDQLELEMDKTATLVHERRSKGKRT